MRNVAISLGFAAIVAGLRRFPPALLVERADGAIRIVLAASLFTIVIAAVVRK